jgi:hypothetical protein
VIIDEPPRRADSAKKSQIEHESPISISLGRVKDVTHGSFPLWAETAAAGTAIPSYVKGIAEELGKRTVKVAPKAYRGISYRFRFRGRGSKALVKAAEIEVRLGDAATTVVLTQELPDEARLMLLDLDLTSDEIRGKALRWDSTEGAWQAFSLKPRRRWLRRKRQQIP